MLKKKLLKKKPLVEVPKSKIITKSKIRMEVNSERLEAFVSMLDKPNIDEAIKIFKKYNMRCCANKLADIRSKDPKLMRERSRLAKKELFSALLKAGIARHFSWKEEN